MLGKIPTVYFLENQKIFGIKGCDFIVSKNSLWHLLQKKFGRKQASTIMPETYILSNEDANVKFTNLFKETPDNFIKKTFKKIFIDKSSLTTSYKKNYLKSVTM